MTLWIMCGIPGSGKSYFAKHKLIQGLGWRYISRDEIRFSMLKNEEEYFKHEKEVYTEFIRRIKIALDEDGICNVIADATHLNWDSRKKLLKALGDSLKGINIIPVYIDTPINVCIERNNKRNGRECVPEKNLKEMYASITSPENDDFKYTAIMRVPYYSKENLV